MKYSFRLSRCCTSIPTEGANVAMPHGSKSSRIAADHIPPILRSLTRKASPIDHKKSETTVAGKSNVFNEKVLAALRWARWVLQLCARCKSGCCLFIVYQVPTCTRTTGLYHLRSVCPHSPLDSLTNKQGLLLPKLRKKPVVVFLAETLPYLRRH